MIKDDGERRLLYELDLQVQGLRAENARSPQLLPLTNIYHNLLRRWSEV
jgi:PKHD-type hydroxylase